MKQIREKISLFIIISLVLPMGVFASSEASITAKQQSVLPATGTVLVIKADQQSRIITQSANQSPTIQSCSLKTLPINNLTQEAAALNLNQPASCFTIVPAKQQTVPILTVVTASSQGVIVVPMQKQISSQPAFTPGPATQDTALPTLIFIVSALIVFEERKSVKKSVIKVVGQAKAVLTIHQLGMVRC